MSADFHPMSLTSDEQTRLLRSLPKYSRDHTIVSLMLGTGLRRTEVVALNVGDIRTPKKSIRTRVRLRTYKRSPGRQAPQHVFLPATLQHALGEFLKRKKRRGEATSDESPLFVPSRRPSQRLSARGLGFILRRIFDRVGLPRFSAHSLRHTYCDRLRQHTCGDLRIVQIAARHANIQTTQRYVHPSAREITDAIRHLPCS